ncbi:2-oxoacid:acceptor oxidoreductase subunit alpha [Halocalculus aciditolerans]|uniref:2-oxoglutarate synthase subunit KorA n=1 Tax=Halocalculus aciditolerans TaxID=1383812 RepID=A0A830F2B4_9EURY|nr:2-oxoacid:acceptor oxidoreductase subunit alpha [Halocalculus aciditolerans]GGL55592.1 2-ketoglutarate ferredoxin oxidoreductase subunit alpha [Halocalculus aciditolerans]
MTNDELIWRIAGGSGDGIDSTSQNFAKALMRAGLHVFTHRHYPSRIRGGHTYVEIRASDEPVKSRGDGYNFLLALGDSFARNPKEDAYYGEEEVKPLSENLDDLREGGVIVYDSGLLDVDEVENFDERVEENDWHVFDVNLRELAKEHGREIMRNTAGVGFTAALVGMELDRIEELMREAMSGDILDANLAVLQDAYDLVGEEYHVEHDVRVPTGSHDEEQVLVSGSHGIAYGALDEGCRFIAGYPMTPWTDVFTILTNLMPDVGGISEQVEDEIAAAALAMGASHTGAKAMSGSSGGGFALMSEPLGLAEMTETPLVLVESMRAGPSTGMPTKPEQADVEHVLFTSQGDSHRVVFAPSDPIECYEQTRRAFQLAYDYQIPAIVVYDQKLSGEYRNVPKSFFDQEPNPDLGSVASEEELAELPHTEGGKFHRFQHDTEEGVSPRSIPGQKGGHFLATGNEHNPAGHISEDPDNRVAQVDRRNQKLDTIREDLADESHNVVNGDDAADFGLISFGSQSGTVDEAVARLNENGDSVKHLSLSEIEPFPYDQVREFVESVDETLVVEMNSSGQLRGHIQRRLGTGEETFGSLLKYDGNPYEPAEVVEAVQHELGSVDETTSRTRLVTPGDQV